MDKKMNNRPKRKVGRIIIWTLVGLVVLAVGSGVRGWMLLSREHREAAGLPLDAVDFNHLADGVYRGYYDGGMYQWRTNECEVEVSDGKVSGIRLLSSKETENGNFDPAMLYERVIREQSLQVDTISGASLTSKAHLQCVENALVKAQ